LKFFNRQRLKLTISVQLLLQFSLFNKYFVIISLTNILFNYFAYLCYITDNMNLVLYAVPKVWIVTRRPTLWSGNIHITGVTCANITTLLLL